MRSKGNIYKLFSFQWISKITSEMQAPYKPNNSICMYFFPIFKYRHNCIPRNNNHHIMITEGNIYRYSRRKLLYSIIFCKSVHGNPVVSMI